MFKIMEGRLEPTLPNKIEAHVFSLFAAMAVYVPYLATRSVDIDSVWDQTRSHTKHKQTVWSGRRISKEETYWL